MTRPALFNFWSLAALGGALAFLVVAMVWKGMAAPERADAFASWAAGIETRLGAERSAHATIQPYAAPDWSLAKVHRDPSVRLHTRLVSLVAFLTLALAAVAFFAPLAWTHWTAHRLSKRALMDEFELAEQKLQTLRRKLDEADRRCGDWVTMHNRRIRETSGREKDLAARLEAALRQVEQLEKAAEAKAKKPASRKAKRAKPDLPDDRGI